MGKDKSIKIRNNLEISKIIYNEFNEEVMVGDFIFDDDASEIYKVVDIYFTPETEYDRVKEKHSETGKMKVMIEAEVVVSSYDYTNNKTESIAEWMRSHSFYRGDIDKLKQQTLDELVNNKNEELELPQSNSTEIAVLDKDLLRQQKSKSIEMKNIMKAKHSYLKGIMNEKLYELRKMKDKFDVVITRINKVIHTLEIYLGINEDIVQIQEGINASAKEPICFRQKLLYMDTEMADPYNEGIDFEHIDKFEDWLLEENSYHKKPNYQVSIPEEKCVAAFRVRAKAKHRDGWHPISKAQAERLDRKTYILIRNGTNIYSIWADINIYPRLFPQRDEFIKKLDHWEGKDKEKNIFKYKLQILLMQGLIERTPIFHPLSKNINLFDPKIHESKLVKFIYDDEVSITDGTITYRNWKKKINENIRPGSRVVISSNVMYHYKGISEFVKERLWKIYYSGTYNVPPAPSSGIYTVYEDIDDRYGWNRKKGEEDEVRYLHKIMYNPKDTVRNLWDYWDSEHIRKNRLSFYINSDDDFVIHWDAIGRKDVKMLEAMIWDRRNRQEYLFAMASLVKIIELKKKEIEQEDNFIQLVYGMNMTTFDKYNITENSAIKLIQDAVEWWKLRNKWKRSLDTNDSKALKMIGQRVIVPSRVKKNIQTGYN